MNRVSHKESFGNWAKASLLKLIATYICLWCQKKDNRPWITKYGVRAGWHTWESADRLGLALPPATGRTGTAPTIGRTGTAPGNGPRPPPFLLEGGISCGGRVIGTGSFSKALYTRCIAFGVRHKKALVRNFHESSFLLKEENTQYWRIY